MRVAKDPLPKGKAVTSMKNTATREPARRSMSLSQKLSLASGAGALIAGITAPQSVEAGIIKSTTLPLSPPAGDSSNFWDVDGDGTDDFKLYNSSTSVAVLTELGAARFVGNGLKVEDGFAKLAAGFNVGATMTGGYKFFGSAQTAITITSVGAIGGDAGAEGWSMGDIGFFGFKFTNTSGVHYGWGQIDIHGASGGFGQGQGFTLTEAYYNSVPNAPIAVGDTGAAAVPEIDPASAGSVLALVMGSLAMLERRRKRRPADDSATTVSA